MSFKECFHHAIRDSLALFFLFYALTLKTIGKHLRLIRVFSFQSQCAWKLMKILFILLHQLSMCFNTTKNLFDALVVTFNERTFYFMLCNKSQCVWGLLEMRIFSSMPLHQLSIRLVIIENFYFVSFSDSHPIEDLFSYILLTQKG